MKAVNCLTKQRNAAREILASEVNNTAKRSYEFCAMLCDKLLDTINVDTVLSKTQTEFVGVTVSNIGYEYPPGERNIPYMEASTICPLLVMQLATYINSCKS